MAGVRPFQDAGSPDPVGAQQAARPLGPRVGALRITGFRGIRSCKLILPNHCVLVGSNNSGKTTIIEALALVLGRDRLVRSLTEHDFFGSDPQPADRIRIVATILDFKGDDPSAAPDWFRYGRAVPKWFDPAKGAVHAEREEATWRLCAQVAFAARFDREALATETARYFVDADEEEDVFQADGWATVSPTLLADIGFFLIPAARTWDRMISFGSELFRRVVSTVGGQPAEAVRQERDRLRVPQSPLEEDPKLKDLVSRTNGELKSLFSRGPQLRLRITATDSESVLEAVTPHYQESGSPALPVRRQGTGLTSLQSLLLLLEFGRLRQETQRPFCLAIEEPELHIPPALQRRLVHRLRARCTQTIATSHSPLVAALFEPPEILLLQERGEELLAVPLRAEPLPADSPNPLRRLFAVNRQEVVGALMYEVALVPEGWTDYLWLRLLLRATELAETWRSEDGDLHFGTFAGVIPTSDGAVVKTFEALRPVHPRVVPLVDGDPAGRGYLKELSGLDRAPRIGIRWPDDWSIEDVVAWVLAGAAEVALPLVSKALGSECGSVADVRDLLALETKKGGRKGDILSYEALAEVIAATHACVERARTLLNSVARVCLDEEGEQALFVCRPAIAATPGKMRVFVMQP